MNSIRARQLELERWRHVYEVARLQLANLMAYVDSEKFWAWPYVNVQDIRTRITEAESEMTFALDLCPMCKLASASERHICRDCEDDIAYGDNVRALEKAESAGAI